MPFDERNAVVIILKQSKELELSTSTYPRRNIANETSGVCSP